MFYARKLFQAICLLAILQFAGHASTKPEILSPRRVMKEVVGRIVQRYFRPVRSEKIVYFANDGIMKSWLPQIRGIRFFLLSRRQIVYAGREVYFFLKPELHDDLFYLTFAHGDGDCNGIGDTWTFDGHNAVATLKQTSMTWASRCQTEAYNTRLLRSPVPDP